MSQRPRKYTGLWAQVGFYASLGFILPAGAVIGFLVGWALDRSLHTSPLLSIVMGFLGAAGGFVEVLRILTRAEKSESRDNSNGGPEQGNRPS